MSDLSLARPHHAHRAARKVDEAHLVSLPKLYFMMTGTGILLVSQARLPVPAYVQTLSLRTKRKLNFDRMKHAIQFPAFRRYCTSRWSVAIKCPSAGHQPMPYGSE